MPRPKYTGEPLVSRRTTFMPADYPAKIPSAIRNSYIVGTKKTIAEIDPNLVVTSQLLTGTASVKNIRNPLSETESFTAYSRRVTSSGGTTY